MTDSREIIAQYLCDRDGQGWSGISPFERAAYRTVALGMIATLAAAGFRILGPDEVDPVTVERAARIAESLSNADHIAYDVREGIFPRQSDVRDAVAAAIRAMEKRDG